MPVPNPEAGWNLVGLTGLLLGAVGWVDILLLWVPPQLGQAEWEFGTASATFEALPLATLGLGLALAGALAEGSRRVNRGLGWFALAVEAFLLFALVLFLLNVPVAWKAVTPATLWVLKKAIAKTVVLAVSYFAIYGTFGYVALRRVKTADS